MEPMIEPVSQPSIIFSPSARERKNKDVETLGNHCTFPHPTLFFSCRRTRSLQAKDMKRMDESDDGSFYDEPRTWPCPVLDD